MSNLKVEVAQLDRQMQFIENEISNLRRRTDNWAIAKIENLERIKETLRQVRQDQVMRGVK